MKILLILLNCILAGGIFWSVLENAGKPAADEDEYFIKRTPGKKKAASQNVTQKKKAAVSLDPAERPAEELAASVVRRNIFDPARCPNARVIGRRPGGNARVTMTLAGTFAIGDVSGAIILQKQQNQQRNMQFPMMGGMPRMMPGQQPNQRGGNQVIRQRFQPWTGIPGQQQNQQEEIVVYKQYVRIGETMANGYKLESVSRTGAVLTKGSERMELTIVEASANAGASSTGNQNNMNPWMMRPPWMMPGMNNRGGRGPGGMQGGGNWNNNRGGRGGNMQQGGGNWNNNRGGGRR